MIGRAALDRLHDAAIRVQLPIVLAAVPVLTAVYALAIVPIATDVALADAPTSLYQDAAYAVRVAAALLVGCVAVATAFAALLLRGSLRATVQRLQAATDAVARGDFQHRVASGRSDELGSLASSIDVMAERLEHLEQARRRMLACVSHELRTPLTIIQGYAFTLARHEQDVVRRDRLELVQAEATRLAGLIEHLVEAASLHAGGVRLRIDRCDLAQLVRDEVDRFEEEAAMRGLRLEVATPAGATPVNVDIFRIGQVLTNLLANAVRHATPDSAVAVSVDVRRGEPARIVVENRCDPIPDEVVEHAFEPFVQGAARTGSVGLGLAIVHAIVVAHGGRVHLDADAARAGAARFTIELPAIARHAQAARTRRAGRRAAIVPRLVVER
ncbi:MAG: hypothetical protein JWL76_135 [Thermoleophilia bacterium]|nr:hypothetical protein [Thermoleophilia bacterium]